MMKKSWLMLLFMALMCCFTSSVAMAETVEEETVNIESLSAVEILARARMMFPEESLKVFGELSVERTRGITESAYPYELVLDWSGTLPRAYCTLYQGATPILQAEMTRVVDPADISFGPRLIKGTPRLIFINSDGSRLEQKNLNTPVGESDLTWIDLVFDYLWWEDGARKLASTECDQRDIKPRQLGRHCVVLEVYPPVATDGIGSILLWVDKSTGFVVQTQYLNEKGGPVRRLWVQRLGRREIRDAQGTMEKRWVPTLFSVQRAGERRPRKTHLRIQQLHLANDILDFTKEQE